MRKPKPNLVGDIDVSKLLESEGARLTALQDNDFYRVTAQRPGDIAQCYADASLALETLGWRAELGIESMCADTWRWQRWAAEHLSR